MRKRDRQSYSKLSWMQLCGGLDRGLCRQEKSIHRYSKDETQASKSLTGASKRFVKILRPLAYRYRSISHHHRHLASVTLQCCGTRRAVGQLSTPQPIPLLPSIPTAHNNEVQKKQLNQRRLFQGKFVIYKHKY